MNWFRIPLALAAVTVLAPAQTTPAPNRDEHLSERQDIVVQGLPDTGYILDIGGGCRGTIGRIKGGTWLIWDSVVPAATSGSAKESYTAWLRTHLPNETIVYGYSILKFGRALDVPYYSGLAAHAGFQIDEVKDEGARRVKLVS